MLLNRWKVQRLLGRVVGVVAGDSSEFAVKTICTVSDEENARLIAAAPEMYEMITKLVDGITIAELLNGMHVVKVNPVLIESAKRLLAEIDGEE